MSFQFQIKDALKALRIEATKADKQYVEEPKTNQRRGRLDLEMESFIFQTMHKRQQCCMNSVTRNYGGRHGYSRAP